ncbi:MAG: hypothetical protein FJW30_09890 [Acidobacteria bacterium]|nr:hypothetical protein [Acidobacteriota bacterium]
MSASEPFAGAFKRSSNGGVVTKKLLILLTSLALLAQPRSEARRGSKHPDHSQTGALGPAVEEAGVASPRAGGSYGRYAVVFEQPPLAETIKSRTPMATVEGRAAAAAVEQSRRAARAMMAARGIREAGTSEILVNAVFVDASPEEAAKLEALPNVKYVQELRSYRPLLSKAHDVIRTAPAWNRLNGQANAGAGVKIAIIDSGIDHTHPMLSPDGLAMPAGYPKCAGADCNFTSAKVIAARSYVTRLVYAFSDDTRPDDMSPRDRVGHGTAAASAAAGVIADTPLGRASGVAPRAHIGNYKVFGSPGVNDLTFDNVIIAALTDALLDGMDIASMSLGGSALWSPNHRGNICDKAGGVACDLQVEAVQNAVRQGLTVVVSAGNEGEAGLELPTLNSVGSPGTAPAAITVGATVNGHILYQSVRVAGLDRINAYFGDGPRPEAPFTGPGRDVSKLENDGRACTPLTNGSLAGAIAIIQRGGCTVAVKVNFAQRAGAAGVVIYNATNANSPLSGLDNTAIPMATVGRDNGQRILQHLAASPDAPVTLDPGLTAVTERADEVAFFSSQGPAIGTFDIKPEIVAVGADLLLATQNVDPNGVMFDASRYTRSTGTSFSAPLVAGAAALVKQNNPRFTPAQIKSALVNSANQKVDDFDYDGKRVAGFQSGIGAGQLDAGKAVQADVIAEPSTVSFGVIRTLPRTAQIRITTTGTAARNLRFSILENVKANGVTVAVSPATATVGPNQVVTLTLTLSGTPPSASNWYEGDVIAAGGATELHIPYAYFVGDANVFNIFALTGRGFTALPGARVGRLNVKAIDKQGVPISGQNVQFRALTGGRIVEANPRTDEVGIASAVVNAGPTLGEHAFSVEIGAKTIEFVGRAIQQPTIQSNGVVNAASGTGGALAPGSYISIFGAGLADTTSVYRTRDLPLSLANISVGFDVPGQAAAQPGRLHFVSPGQINLQIPWELAGNASVNVKVSNGDFSSATFRVPLNDVSPAAFEFTDPASGRLLAAALDQNFAVATPANAVARGSIAQIYANGLGPVSNTPPSGEPAGAEPLSLCRVQPEVTIGGVPATVPFCGLAPGFVGLYQLNVTVPAGAPAGIQPLVIRSGNVTSKTSALPVR